MEDRLWYQVSEFISWPRHLQLCDNTPSTPSRPWLESISNFIYKIALMRVAGKAKWVCAWTCLEQSLVHREVPGKGFAMMGTLVFIRITRGPCASFQAVIWPKTPLSLAFVKTADWIIFFVLNSTIGREQGQCRSHLFIRWYQAGAQWIVNQMGDHTK